MIIQLSLSKGPLTLSQSLITTLFNQSVANGTFPDTLKTAKKLYSVTNLAHTMTLNRQILKLQYFLKYLRLMKSHLVHYLEYKHIFNPSQYGFRSSYGTFKALNTFSATSNKLSVLSVLLILLKLDTINHKVLINKMNHYGIFGYVFSWFRDYLTDRHQYTFFNGEKSSPTRVTLDAPHGSVLGPISLLIYNNDVSGTFFD